MTEKAFFRPLSKKKGLLAERSEKGTSPPETNGYGLGDGLGDRTWAVEPQICQDGTTTGINYILKEKREEK